jgi:hypothetical protein
VFKNCMEVDVGSFDPLKHSGNYTHTPALIFSNSDFCPQRVFTGFL